MPLSDELLNPVGGPSPGGIDVRYTLYDAVKEARREEAVPPPGMTERDRKVADNALVINLTREALTKKTKDLWLAAWLSEALLKQNGFDGLCDGLTLCYGLIERFWDTLYPALEDGDLELRRAPLEFVGTRLDVALKSVRLVEREPYGFADLEEARKLGHEADAKSNEAKQARAAAIKQGKVPLEAFDKCLEETPKAFYTNAEKGIDGCLQILAKLKECCDAKFGALSPSFGNLESVLGEIRPVVHGLLQRKREKEPDPKQEDPPREAPGTQTSGTGEDSRATPAPAGFVIPLESSTETPERLEAIRKIVEAAAFLRHREPCNPAAYLMLRGLRWGELRAAIAQFDQTQLAAPPIELRKHLKLLSLNKKWEELLEASENAMALPCSRAWLDLQRYVIAACQALGPKYETLARAILAELKLLITDIPQLVDATLMDDMPAANAETRAWLKSLSQEAPSQTAERSTDPPVDPNGSGSRWPGQPVDMWTMALQALRDGQERKAFEILQKDLAGQRSGRERFRRKMQLVQICISMNKQNIAQPILDDLAAAIETHKLDDWEDPEMVAGALATIMRLSGKVQADKAQQQKLFERICRLDATQALGDGK
jgi:type VI secretion system protein ImpA